MNDAQPRLSTTSRAIEGLSRGMGLSEKWLSDALGETHPQRTARERLAELLEPSRYLGGIRPAEAIRAGRADRVEAALDVLDSGVFV